MAVVEKFEYKNQGIQILKVSDRIKRVIVYFPKGWRVAFKRRLCSSEVFADIDAALKSAKQCIDLEVEKGNWIKPTKKILGDDYRHIE